MDQTPDLQRLMRLAQSPAGQQLLRLMRQQGGKELEAAAKSASVGDISQAQSLLSSLLQTPEAKKLLKQLEECK